MSTPKPPSGSPNRKERRLARRASRLCVHCGKPGAISDDHLPPKNLFARPLPSDLIKVPACQRCNSSCSKDDEYFRLKIALDDEVSDHPVVKLNLNSILKSLEREEAGGLRRLVAADTRMVNLLSPGGVYLGKRLAFEVDLVRIFRVVACTVRGLYFHETGRRLSDEYAVGVNSDDTLMEEPLDVLAQWQEAIIRPMAAVPEKRIGDGVFGYRHVITTEDQDTSVWVLTFYGRKAFLALTGPKSVIERRRPGEQNLSAAERA